MKYSIKKVIVAALAISLLTSFFVYERLGGFRQEGELERYVYPSDFSDCWSVEQRQKKCRIPEEVLSEMTVEELVWAVIDYPFLYIVGLSSYWPSGGSVSLTKSSDAFAKLTECRNPENKIIKVLKEASEAEDVDASQICLAVYAFYGGQDIYFNFSKKQLKFLSKY